MKKDSCYFSHDSNAKDDPKCMLLIDQLGMEGYGIYWMLVEVLREQPDYKCPLNLVPILARRYNTTTEKVKTVISQYDLFKIDEEKNFFSFSLIRRMTPLLETRERRSMAGKIGNEIRWNRQKEIANQSQCDNDAIANGSQTDRKSSQSKVKESKVKESIDNIESGQKSEKVTAAKAATLSRKNEFYKYLIPFVETYGNAMIRKFFDYWSEFNKSGTKMRFELERTWELSKRLAKWANNDAVDKNNSALRDNSVDKYKNDQEGW